MRVELVVFDVAGTTVIDDDHVANGLRQALLDVGVVTDLEACARVMGLAKPVAIRALARGKVPEDSLAEAVVRAHTAFTEKMVDHYRSSRAVRAMPGAEEAFQALRDEGVLVALDTGFSRRILEAVLERLGWTDEVIDLSVASDEVEAGRPHPFMIRRAMALVGIDIPEVVMKVGDTVADMGEGVSAHAGAIVGVLSGTGKRDELERAGATHIVADVGAVPSLVLATRRGRSSPARRRRVARGLPL